MLFILISILCSTCILIIFRIGDRIGARTRHIIVVGYLVSALAGALIFSVSPLDVSPFWLAVAVVYGIAFYAVFRFMAISAASSGISITSIAAKMSVVIPIMVGILVLGEVLNTLILLGIICGLVATWLTIGGRVRVADWYWPLLVFVGSGLIDASFKLFQVYGLTAAETPAFLATIFGFAFLTSLLHHLTYAERRINQRSVLVGIGLGLANLSATYFIMMALAIPELDSIFVYSLNNFGAIVTSVLVALVIFREPISARGWGGLLLAVVSILLLYKGYV